MKNSKKQSDQFKVGDIVIIKKYIGDEYNEEGRVESILDDGRVWVTNTNMPYMGTVSAFFKPEALKKR